MVERKQVMIDALSIYKEAQDIKDEIVTNRRYLHSNPEVGRHLENTTSFVLNKLKEYGYEPKCICDSGIVATIKGNKEGKCFMLRSDMDALNVVEKSGLSFSSTNGCMHACGHDMHTSMLLAASKLLMKYKDDICGTVKIVFQPDEEGFTGAKEMIASDVLEDPKPDCALALHVHSGTPTGVVLYAKEMMMAGCTLFKIEVDGVGCHGAMPETGVDPINIACDIYKGIQEITSREIEAKKPAVITIGKFQAGSLPNVIPSTCVMEGSIRTFDQKLTDKIFTRIKEISENIASAYRGKATATITSFAPPLYNDPGLTDELTSYVKEITSDKAVIDIKEGGMGSEDFASYTYKLPCTYMLIGAGSVKEDERYGKPMHNEAVVFNEDILPLGAAIHTYCALKWLSGHE